MYEVLDVLFVVVHTGLVVFILTGWIWRSTRQFHLIAGALTVLSWIGLGAFYGWGYCPCTDWHWQVKRKLGQTDLPASYVKYYLDRITGVSWDPAFVDASVVTCALAALCLSTVIELRHSRQDRR